MDPLVHLHRPTGRARQRAAAAGLDLEALKASDPLRYKLLNAEPLVFVHESLMEHAQGVFAAGFRAHDLFQRPLEPEYAELLVFPALEPGDLERLDAALGRLAELPQHRARHAYYRVVSDARGAARQLGLPLAPERWVNEVNRLVGPFASQLEAETWAETARAGRPTLLFDAVAHGGVWLCDVFAGLEPG